MTRCFAALSTSFSVRLFPLRRFVFFFHECQAGNGRGRQCTESQHTIISSISRFLLFISRLCRGIHSPFTITTIRYYVRSFRLLTFAAVVLARPRALARCSRVHSVRVRRESLPIDIFFAIIYYYYCCYWKTFVLFIVSPIVFALFRRLFWLDFTAAHRSLSELARDASERADGPMQFLATPFVLRMCAINSTSALRSADK